MSGRGILRFDRGDASAHRTRDNWNDGYDLFAHSRRFNNRFVFINTESIDQKTLIRLIHRYSVSAIADLRLTGLFKSPRYNHKEMADFIYDKGIQYFNFSRVFLESDRGSIRRRDVERRDVKKLLSALSKGLCIVLVDDEVKEGNLVMQVRKTLRKYTRGVAELNPRALI